MNYIKHYEYLCYSRQLLNRKKSKTAYYELHHILPKSLGGDNSDSNLVLLTAKEHYIAHLLLYNYYKTIGGDSLRKMAFALVSMAAYKNSNTCRIRITSSRTYATIREAAILSRLGKKVEDTTNYQKPKTKEHANAIRNARLKSPPRSAETREKMRESALARGNNFTGNFSKTTCTFCKKVGQENAMKRWHFGNCKFKTETTHD